jgi:hypothetical protein
VAERTEQTIKAISERGYHVIGELEELRPVHREGGRNPDDATDAELLESALDALSLLAEKSARMWWERRRDVIEQDGAAGGGMGDRARSAVFASQRKALQLADRNRLVAKAVEFAVSVRNRVAHKRKPAR